MRFERLNDFIYFSEVEENCIRKYSEKIPTELLGDLERIWIRNIFWRVSQGNKS